MKKHHVRVSIVMGVSQNGWYIHNGTSHENLDDLGCTYTHFRKPSCRYEPLSLLESNLSEDVVSWNFSNWHLGR